MPETPEISIVIVNYNSGNFLLMALESLIRATGKIPAEILVVDNASTDQSVPRAKSIFPDIQLIQNTQNLGFAAANNIGIRQSSGEYILLINPDTIVPEGVITLLIEFMHKTPDAGAVGVKILNADGTFSVDSRHSVPSPWTAFWKQIGFDRLFPRNRIFGQYNLTYLDPDETYPVDAISGSFMFLRRQAVNQVGLLDEDFFMYCEDLDYCYRITRAEWLVYYYSGTSILHYKGESTSKHKIRYSLTFNRSLYLFYRKHFNFRFNFPMHLLILTGVILRGIITYGLHQAGNVVFRITEWLWGSGPKVKSVVWIGVTPPGEKTREWLYQAGYLISGWLAGRRPVDENPESDLPFLGILDPWQEINILPAAQDWMFDADALSFKFVLEVIQRLKRRKLNFIMYSSRMQTVISKNRMSIKPESL